MDAMLVVTSTLTRPPQGGENRGDFARLKSVLHGAALNCGYTLFAHHRDCHSLEPDGRLKSPVKTGTELLAATSNAATGRRGTGMYYRISTYQSRAGSLDALIAKADALREQMKALPGVRSIQMIDMGGDHYMTLAAYDNAEEAASAAESVKALYAELADLIDLDTLKFEGGNVAWEL